MTELTLGDGFEIVWATGYPMHETQQDAAFYRDDENFICTVKHEGFEVDIYCDGDMKVKNREDGETYRYGGDLITAGFDTDENLQKANEQDTLYWDMNPWFDMYVRGEHLDNVHHEIGEALQAAKAWLDEEVQNAKLIEDGVV
jgi:hypothetical protein